MKNVQLLIIDPQNDFCNPKGSLFVAGADGDSERLAAFINKNGKIIDEIHVTLDSHRTLDIAHPIMWLDSKGKNPAPFTIISVDDVVNGVWSPVNPSWRQMAIDYVKALEANGRYPLCIWPPHCIIGSWGHSIEERVSKALIDWELQFIQVVDYVTKGSNIFTEHYSAYVADVQDPNDPTTMPNINLLNMLQEADIILISGEARSHCIANTIRDIMNDFGDENIKKFVLLEDTTSDVPGFEQLGEDFVKELKDRGGNTAKSIDDII